MFSLVHSKLSLSARQGQWNRECRSTNVGFVRSQLHEVYVDECLPLRYGRRGNHHRPLQTRNCILSEHKLYRLHILCSPLPIFVVESEWTSSSVHVGKSGFWCSFTSCERHDVRSLHRDSVSGPARTRFTMGPGYSRWRQHK